MKPIAKSFLYSLLTIILLLYLANSYLSYMRSTIDGDFTGIVLGIPPFDKVLEDPLGFAALQGETYAAPNRFTAHAVMVGYFRYAPLALQTFVSPIDSIYLSIVLAKIVIHISLLLLLSYYASAWSDFKLKYILIAAVLMCPLFYAADIFNMHMALIDNSITYTMFYALPMIALLIFYLPIYHYFTTGKIPRSKIFLIGWIFFSLVLALFGPLTAPVILVSIAVIFPYLLYKNFYAQNEPNISKRLWQAIQKIDKTVLIIFLFAGIWSLYSIYIGLNNSENDSSISLTERYSILLKGINEVFFTKESGIIYILIGTAINLVLAFIFYGKKNSHYFKLVFALLVFALLYIALLPMGGYRWYRPLILRRDTIMPVLCILYFYWATSSILLITQLSKLKKIIPLITIVLISVFYTRINSNAFTNSPTFCEKKSIIKVAASKNDCILLDKEDCPIGLWDYNTKCEDSKNVAALLEYYNITPRKIYFHFPEEKK